MFGGFIGGSQSRPCMLWECERLIIVELDLDVEIKSPRFNWRVHCSMYLSAVRDNLQDQQGIWKTNRHTAIISCWGTLHSFQSDLDWYFESLIKLACLMEFLSTFQMTCDYFVWSLFSIKQRL